MSMTTPEILIAIVMLLATAVSMVPFVPGPALVWAIGIIYALATDVQQVGLFTIVIMTILMLIGSTADWWTRLLVLGSEGKLSCATFAISTAGAIAGTILIPIPLVGTVAGAALAIMAWVFYQESDWEKAFKAARGILSAWIASFFVEFVVSISIAVLFIRALLNS